MKSKLFILFVLLSLTSCRKEIVLEEEDLVEPTESTERSATTAFTIKNVESFDFPLPAQYRQNISSLQGLRAGNEIYSTNYHNAIDIAVPIRTKVFAAKEGRVENVYPGSDNGPIWKGHPVYGGLIELVHDDGTRTLYAHLIRTDVREGDRVERGQIIGASGGQRGERGSGITSGPHLHFSIYVDIMDVMD